MKLNHYEICIIKELIDLNSMYFNKAEYKNPIKQSINDNLDFYNPFGKLSREINQDMFHRLKTKIDQEFKEK
tara:strand:+ start:396 stop:611 length:216 start_codon:yes stop_codon:yes gene_type:complete